MNTHGASASEAWRAALGTAAGYALVLIAMFLALFVLPYLLFLLV